MNLSGRAVAALSRYFSIAPDEILVAHGLKKPRNKAWFSIELPKVDPFVAPILYAIPVQLLAYHAAVSTGTDIDQPRNLAKSVTVE